MNGVKLHPKHGLAPVMTACSVCHADIGIALLGIKADSVCQQAFGIPFERVTSTHKLLGQLCDTCQKAIDSGAVAFICYETGSAAILKKDFADQNKLKPGTVYSVTESDIKAVLGPEYGKETKWPERNDDHGKDQKLPEERDPGTRPDCDPGDANPTSAAQ